MCLILYSGCVLLLDLANVTIKCTVTGKCHYSSDLPHKFFKNTINISYTIGKTFGVLLKTAKTTKKIQPSEPFHVDGSVQNIVLSPLFMLC